MKKLFVPYLSAFVLLLGAMVLCALFIENIVISCLCAGLIGFSNGLYLANVIELATRVKLERRLHTFAKEELMRFNEWEKSHPDCDWSIYVDKRNNEIAESGCEIKIGKKP